MYQESPWVNPLAGSIADHITRSADARAQALRANGQIQAQAAQQIGQTIANIPGQIAGAKAAQQESTIRQAQIVAGQRDTQGRQVLAGAIKQYTTRDPQSGALKVDHDAIANAVSQAGFPDQAESWLKTASANKENLAKLDQLQRDYQTHAMQTLGDLAFESKTPADFVSAVGLAASHGLIDPQQAQQIAGATGSPQADAIRQQYLQFSPKQQAQQAELSKPMSVPEGGVVNTPERGAAGLPPLITGNAKPPTEAELALQANGGDPKAAMAALKPPPVESAQSVDKLLDGKPTTLMFDPKTKQYTDASGAVITNAATRIKPIPPASMQINQNLVPSGDALTMAARRYLATGELPAMGMGQAGAAARVAVMNEAAKIDPQASLSANAATFKADSANLKNLQTTEGSLSAFEKTAGKNLDQFLSLAEKIPDTGVPWLNTPVRLLNANTVGSANQAAFNAARDVALREIARVTNDPKLSGVLSDSARHDVSALNPQNATFAQIKAVAKVLTQDMANVHASLTDQIASVKSGMQAPAAAGGDVIYARDPQGQLHQAKKGTTLPAGWKLEAKP